MRDLRKYWHDVNTLAASLPEFVWVAGEDGCLVEASARVAAKLLVGKTHRLASEEEIRARGEADAARSRERLREARRKRGIEVVEVTGK
ncbi:MAG TPA: hypothetical protein VMB85_21440 [Bryobacteraceae bacterium]|nr:hypothetical protein [Bryobacteraceae bacterium]